MILNDRYIFGVFLVLFSTFNQAGPAVPQLDVKPYVGLPWQSIAKPFNRLVSMETTKIPFVHFEDETCMLNHVE